MFVSNALDDKPLPLYRSSANRREWLFVTDHCCAIDLILKKGVIGELYNIGNGSKRASNRSPTGFWLSLVSPKASKPMCPIGQATIDVTS